MNDSTSEKNSPKTESLNFIKAFARIYHPNTGQTNSNEVQAELLDFQEAFC